MNYVIVDCIRNYGIGNKGGDIPISMSSKVDYISI
jgi:hypothetical protein